MGPDHKKTFSCQVIVGERLFKEGSGPTKIVAKKNAAMHALESLFDMPVEIGTLQFSNIFIVLLHTVVSSCLKSP